MAIFDTSVPNKKIVILGGSYGGISTAHYLLKHAIPPLSDPSTYQVVLISTASQAMCRPACPRAMISDDMLDQNKLFVSIPDQFEQYSSANFKFIHGTATKLNHTARVIEVDVKAQGGARSESIEYYALVIATGASTPSPLLGLNGGDVDTLKSEWTRFREVLPKVKDIVVSGGGPAGVETAGELGEHLNGRPSWLFPAKMKEPRVSITVVTAGPRILPALRPALATKAENYLANVGVTVLKNARVTSTVPDTAGTTSARSISTDKITVRLEDGRALSTDLYIPATGTRPNSSFISPSLLTSDGRIATNPSTLRVDSEEVGPRVYAIGDVSSYARPAIHVMLEAVPVLCANIKRDLISAFSSDQQGKQAQAASVAIQDKIFQEDTRETQMVPIGTGAGVGAAMGYALPSLLIWAIKGRDYWLWTTSGLWSGKQWAKEVK